MSEKIYRVQMNSKGMPNFSTAVEIADRLVRCGECKHGQDDLIHMFCAYHHHKTYADDFCSYGEREGE